MGNKELPHILYMGELEMGSKGNQRPGPDASVASSRNISSKTLWRDNAIRRGLQAKYSFRDDAAGISRSLEADLRCSLTENEREDMLLAQEYCWNRVALYAYQDRVGQKTAATPTKEVIDEDKHNFLLFPDMILRTKGGAEITSTMFKKHDYLHSLFLLAVKVRIPGSNHSPVPTFMKLGEPSGDEMQSAREELGTFLALQGYGTVANSAVALAQNKAGRTFLNAYQAEIRAQLSIDLKKLSETKKAQFARFIESVFTPPADVPEAIKGSSDFAYVMGLVMVSATISQNIYNLRYILADVSQEDTDEFIQKWSFMHKNLVTEIKASIAGNMNSDTLGNATVNTAIAWMRRFYDEYASNKKVGFDILLEQARPLADKMRSKMGAVNNFQKGFRNKK